MPRSRTLLRIRSPSFSPGPRYEFTLERFALSNDALNTKGTGNPESAVASIWTCSSLSITHGPAINASGPPPISTVEVIRTIAESLRHAGGRREHVCRVAPRPARGDSPVPRPRTPGREDAAPGAWI